MMKIDKIPPKAIEKSTPPQNLLSDVTFNDLTIFDVDFEPKSDAKSTRIQTSRKSANPYETLRLCSRIDVRPSKKIRNRFRIDTEKRSKKASPKNVSKIDCGLHFEPPKPSESFSKSHFQIFLRICSKPVSQSYATRPQIVPRHRALELCDCLPGLSKD